MIYTWFSLLVETFKKWVGRASATQDQIGMALSPESAKHASSRAIGMGDYKTWNGTVE